MTASAGSGQSVAECLAEVVKKCLMCDDTKAYHVYGLDFITACDDILMSTGDE